MMRNTFLEKKYTKCVEENIPRLFSKKPKWSISLDQQSKYTVCFYCSEVESYRNILNLSCRPLAFTSYKVF